LILKWKEVSVLTRPSKLKLVEEAPRSDYYKPRGISMSELEEINITLEELEALRLVDLEGLYQADAAKRMGISRQTIQRMITGARSKMVGAILGGKALRIEGGNYVLKEGAGVYRCGRCGGELPFLAGKRSREWRCLRMPKEGNGEKILTIIRGHRYVPPYACRFP
jgi:predicted DNA-binding protein (UPF0251 family)